MVVGQISKDKIFGAVIVVSVLLFAADPIYVMQVSNFLKLSSKTFVYLLFLIHFKIENICANLKYCVKRN